MGCLKLTYQDISNHLKVVYSNPFALENNTQRFLSVDPLAAKYTDLSPYNFVANNPILFVDADGREIIIVDSKNKNEPVLYHPTDPEIREKALRAGASEFVLQTYAALDKLANEYGPHYANIVNELVTSTTYKTYIIQTSTFNDQSTSFAPANGFFNPEGQVNFNPFMGLIVGQSDASGNHNQSPAIGLGHELEHIINHLIALKEFNDYVQTKSNEGLSMKAIRKLEEYQSRYNKVVSTSDTRNHIEAEEEPTAKNEKTAGGAFRNFYADVLGVFKAKCSTCTEVSTDISPKEQSEIDSTNNENNVKK